MNYNDVLKAKSNASSPIPKIIPEDIFLKYRSKSDDVDKKSQISYDIYPNDFFNVQNPQAVYIEIDIKTSENIWVSLSSEQNNFFKDLKIEDSGGAKKFTLSLFDRDFYNLEELISGTVAFSQTSYNFLNEQRTEYTREAISIKSELTTEQINEIYKQRKELLDKILKKKNYIEAINPNTGVPISTGGPSTRYNWYNAHTDSKTSAKICIEILSYFTKIYMDYIRVTEDDFKEPLAEDEKKYFTKIEMYKASNFMRNNYKQVISSLSSIVNTKNLTEDMMEDFLYSFIYYMSISGGRNVFSVAYAIPEYKFYTSNSLNSLRTAIGIINNAEKSYIKENTDKVEASNNLIQLIEMKNEVQPNIRIRFGYTDQNYGGETTGAGAHYAENAIELGTKEAQTKSGSVNIAYQNRANTKYTMIRGPYYNFMITGVQSKIAKEGLYYTLTGFSMSSMKFDKFKLVQKFAKLKGTASEILAGLFITFNEKLEAKKDTTTIKSPIRLKMYTEDYYYIKNNYDNTEVEISLGSESCIGNTISYKSIRTLFNDICSAFPKKQKIESNSKTVKIMTQDSEGNAGEVEQTKTSDLYPLSYIVKDGVSNEELDGTEADKGIEVIFYYKEPKKTKYCRVYDWGMTRNSIVKDLEINNKNEYASLASFSMYDKNNKEFTIDDFRQASAGYKLKATNYTDDFILTNQVLENINPSSRKRLKNAINNALINSLYEGSITIPGDPFYSFDDNIVPYCYPIKINVWRASGSQEKYSRKDSPGEPKLSYVSGHYVITSISHNINLSGFTTTLGIMKYPGIEDTLS